MKKIIIGLYAILATFLLVTSLISASMIVPANDKAKENSPVIGENGGLERVDFIHYAKSVNPARPIKTETCYKLMGVKWNTLPVNYVINPTNPQGLSDAFVTSTISTSAETWDYSTQSELFNNAYRTNSSANYGVQDYQNTIDFGDYPNNGVIAVTSVWYTRVGKQIVEFDMRFNTRFNWGDATTNSLLMDLQNIATHELGHAVGLADIYSTTCLAVTMYGYSTEGDTSKRTLETPDITGLQKMYGL
ncbi:MAG: matrixin family metalloprotease [Nanoarchaeota archaeon]